MSVPSLARVDGLTVQDYLQTPDGPPWYELVEGRLLLEPSPTSDHQSIIRELVVALCFHLRRFPIGTLFFAPLDVYLDDSNVFQPDIAVILHSHREIITPRGIRGAPDLVVEVLSPSNHRTDRGPKRLVYARAGVRELWIVDPAARTIERFLLDRDPAEPAEIWRPGDTVTTALFPGFSVPTDEIFQR